MRYHGKRIKLPVVAAQRVVPVQLKKQRELEHGGGGVKEGHFSISLLSFRFVIHLRHPRNPRLSLSSFFEIDQIGNACDVIAIGNALVFL